MNKKGLDQGKPRPDAKAKATGKALYVDDIKFPRMLHGYIFSSPLASAKLEKLDIAKAKAAPGIHTILTADNLPGSNRIGMIFDDEELLVSSRVRMSGDRLALIAAETQLQAKKAAELINLKLQETPGVYDCREALSPSAPQIHPEGNVFKEFNVRRGNLDETVLSSDIIIEEDYEIGGQEHAYLETQGTIAVPQADDSWHIYSTTQCPYYIRARVSRFLGITQNKVRVFQTVTGGAFGGKEDFPDEPALCATALAKATGRPVKVIYPRKYDMQSSTKRHSMKIKHKLFATKQGQIKGVKLDIDVDAGAYAGLSTVVAERANISSVGPYDIPNIQVKTKVIYTNNLYGGPYRGFGAPQVSAVHEAQIDKLARTVGKDRIEIRRINGMSAQKRKFASGEELAQPHLYQELLNKLEKISKWRTHLQPPSRGNLKEGIGIGTMIYGVNLHWGGQRLDRGAAYLVLLNDGSISLAVGVTDMGQGANAAMRTICAAALGISEDLIQISEVDTDKVPDSGPTVASRATMSGGRAVIDAVNRLKPKLDKIAAQMLDCEDPGQVECKDGIYQTKSNQTKTVSFEKVVEELYLRRINPAAIGWYRSEPRQYDPETGQGKAYAFYAFGGHVTRVQVDTDTGRVNVLETTAVHDVGKIINYQGIKGQVHGGTVQGLGWALMEEFKLNKGKMMNAGFSDYLIPTSMDMPEKLNMDFIEEPQPQGPFGAKGIGEPSFISVGASVISAVSHALNQDLKILPLTPQNIVESIRKND
ncbi:MAG: xanthine dehydrogenase family protein molybdopterin-binding subunit [Deltaproteobacteria bacterium]|jgi:CO/xanthine dehydrogenase Mo-binding subunit|nr:xanthine dehydrogenase family protein molybdopterin-binding subunit [Deltaproteobacteria bacterium]